MMLRKIKILVFIMFRIKVNTLKIRIEGKLRRKKQFREDDMSNN